MEPISLYTQQYQQMPSSARTLAALVQETTAGAIRRETDTSAPLSVDEQKAKLRESTKDFEAIFVRQLLKNMRSTLENGGMFGDGTAGEIYSDMMENALADKIAESGDLGLGEQLYRRLVIRIDPSEGGPTAPPPVEIPKDLTSE